MTVQPLNSVPYPNILTVDEIRERYPKEWVLIADTESDEDFNVIKGTLLAHSPSREEIDQALLSLSYSNVRSLAIEYTGPIPDDYAVIL